MNLILKTTFILLSVLTSKTHFVDCFTAPIDSTTNDINNDASNESNDYENDIILPPIRKFRSNWTRPETSLEPKPKYSSVYPPIDPDHPQCDKKSIGFIANSIEELEAKRKIFRNCTFNRGEVVTFQNVVFPKEILMITCRSTFPINDTVKSTPVRYEQHWILNTYIDPRNDVEPEWRCVIKRFSDRESEINLEPYEGFNVKNTFEYDVRSSGLYDMNPVLVTRWTAASQEGSGNGSNSSSEENSN